MRLIDADILLEKFEYLNLNRLMKEDIKTIVNNQPTVKNEIVGYGEWESYIDDYYDDKHFICSSCKSEWMFSEGTPEDYNWHYCPHCGVKMDMEVENNEID